MHPDVELLQIVKQVFFKMRCISVISLQNGRCHFKSADVGATDTGFVDITQGDESALQSAVATVGPIAVAIDASHMSFQVRL